MTVIVMRRQFKNAREGADFLSRGKRERKNIGSKSTPRAESLYQILAF